MRTMQKLAKNTKGGSVPPPGPAGCERAWQGQGSPSSKNEGVPQWNNICVIFVPLEGMESDISINSGRNPVQ
jgi:hypothetical protein